MIYDLSSNTRVILVESGAAKGRTKKQNYL